MNRKPIARPELLAPAGDLEKLMTAVRFGADAVYAGAGDYSLRSPATSFSLEELKQGIRFAHEHGVKFYLALNIFAYDRDLEPLLSYFKKAVQYGIDAVIISDPGILALISQYPGNYRIHLSTQANTTNSEAVKFWCNQGVSRIILARELSLTQIQEIRSKVPYVELEAFVHGAMCMSYSGRCLISNFMTDRAANHGECAQPCRWEYQIKEIQKPDILTVSEDTRGTYLFNSKDLCMIEYVPELVESGLTSLKLEGRMKSAYYTAAVTRSYSSALAAYCAAPNDYHFLPEWLDELIKVSHRPYSTGFFFPEKNNQTEYFADSAYIKSYDFVGVVTGESPELHQIKVAVRNKISTGDELEILDPHSPEILRFTIEQLRRENGEYINAAHNQYTVLLSTPLTKISKHSILRRRRAS